MVLQESFYCEGIPANQATERPGHGFGDYGLVVTASGAAITEGAFGVSGSAVGGGVSSVNDYLPNQCSIIVRMSVRADKMQ